MDSEAQAELGALAPGLVIRAATVSAADCSQLAAILNESILDGTITADAELKDAQYFVSWLQRLQDREGILLLCAEEGVGPTLPAEYGGVIGFGVIKLWSERAGYRYTCETSVYCRHSLRGHGYGSMLKRALIERCREWGYHHLIARTTADNERSIRNNLRIGYQITGIQPQVTCMNGAWMDGVLLHLILEDVQPEPSELHNRIVDSGS
jgi:phosphinothricin acetyltransferase